MIAMKIFKFVEVATSHNATKKLIEFLRLYEETAVIYVNRWQVEWSARSLFFRPYRSFGAILLLTGKQGKMSVVRFVHILQQILICN